MKAPALDPRKWRKAKGAGGEDDASSGAPVDASSPSSGESGEDQQFEWTTGSSALVERVTNVGLFAALAAGVVALVLLLTGFGQQAASTTPASAVDDPRAGERAAVSAFAEEFVSTWLTTPRGQEQRLTRFVEVPDSIALPRKPWSASSAAVAGIEETDTGAWSVTVAVDVTADRTTSRQFFRVPVTYSGGSLVAQALPAPVAAPRMAGAVELNYPEQVLSDRAVVAAAGDFLSALLTGDADLTRFVTPGVEIEPVLPPPYRTVSVQSAYADQAVTEADEKPETGVELHLLVTAEAAVDRLRETTVQYALTMRARSGRWEVASIDPAPVTAPGSGEAS